MPNSNLNTRGNPVAIPMDNNSKTLPKPTKTHTTSPQPSAKPNHDRPPKWKTLPFPTPRPHLFQPLPHSPPSHLLSGKIYFSTQPTAPIITTIKYNIKGV